MTCVATSQELLPEPQSVKIGNLALAAGIAGHSVAICYDGFPAPILCELWKHHTNCVGTERVFQVSSQADIRKLSGQVGSLRLVLVHSPRSYNPAAWAIQMATPGVPTVSRPTLFSRSAPAIRKTILAPPLSCGPMPRNATPSGGGWRLEGPLILIGRRSPPQRLSKQLPSYLPVVSSNDPLTTHCLPRFRDHQILNGLLAGACLLRAVRQNNPTGMPFTLGLQDYELVRGLLQSPLVGSADESNDPLTADMVNRANVFMAVKCESGQEDNTVCSLDGGDVHRRNHNARPPRELITRRQVADLGNVRSRTVRRLVEHLQNQPDGYERFGRWVCCGGCRTARSGGRRRSMI